LLEGVLAFGFLLQQGQERIAMTHTFAELRDASRTPEPHETLRRMEKQAAAAKPQHKAAGGPALLPTPRLGPIPKMPSSRAGSPSQMLPIATVNPPGSGTVNPLPVMKQGANGTWIGDQGAKNGGRQLKKSKKKGGR
jgi:hypothetical protein